MQIQKRLDEIEAAKARVGTLIKDFFADLHIEMHRLGTFRPVPEQITNQARSVELEMTTPIKKRGSKRAQHRRETAHKKALFLKRAKKSGAHIYSIAHEMGLHDSTVSTWMKQVKAGKL